MRTGIALCRHPLTQFGYASVAKDVDLRLLCHPAKSQVAGTDTGVPAEHIAVYQHYDTNARVEYDAARIIESTDCAGIIALSEVDVLRAAQLRSSYGLPGMGYQTALLFRDKIAMKRRLAEAAIRVPRHRSVDSGLDVRQAAAEYGFPFVLKPRLGGGSVGAEILRDEAELVEALDRGLWPNFYTPAHLEAEEFVEGRLHHIDGLIIDGQLRVHTVSAYRSDLLEFATPVSSLMIDQHSATADRLTDFTVRVLAELGLFGSGIHSYFHCEVFDAGDGLVLCEVAARPGGLGIVDQLDSYHGVSTFEWLLASTLLGETWSQLPAGPSGDLVGFVGIPVGWTAEQARALVPDANWLGQRVYDRGDRPAQQISSVDMNAVMMVRGRTEAELDGVLQAAAGRLGQPR
ncbi:MAG TPA: hypothetical protein VFD94_01690 [Jatrophihabitans sp.]|jgi:biotin carboxylase|nr:hypothetical protein [Jatrophihabitans sp.]